MRHTMRGKKQKGLTLVFAALALICLLPLVGLVVDVGFLYGVKTQLQASVDGAALAGARAMVLDAAASDTTNTVNNATTWFYSNFPNGTWNTTSTSLSTPQVYEDCAPPSGTQNAPGCNLNLWHVDVTASTQVPTYFMRWFGARATSINAVGKATRRNVVAMIVLDRSGSMCTGGSTPCGASQTTLACAAMISAAKVFVGQFANGRDYIGMVTFNLGVHVTQPTQDFRSSLGYTDALGVSNTAPADIDNIKCTGGTGTGAGIATAYNELYKLGQAGALNVVLLETDGLPNSIVINQWDSVNSKTGIANASGGGCKDINNRTISGGGWTTSAAQRTWIPNSSLSGTSYPTIYGSGSYFSAPTGPYQSFYTSDPSQGSYFIDGYVPFDTSDSSSETTISNTSTQAYGCTLGSSFSPGASTADEAWFPNTDVFGAKLNAPGCTTGLEAGPCRYKTVTTVGTPSHINISTWQNAKYAVFNAVDNAGYNIRADTSLKPLVYTIALDGNGGDPPDLPLLQRLANDSTSVTTACTSPPSRTGTAFPTYTVGQAATVCQTFSAQQAGKFIYSPGMSQLRQSFLALSSQMLRLNQ